MASVHKARLLGRIGATTLVLAMGVGWLTASPAHARTVALDLVFVIDTTGSMSHEIREAKERVKQLAEALDASRPDQRLRIGVVAYRDRGDEYVTKLSDLSENVDDSFTFLASLRAGGGGDGPEDVLSGLAAAIDQMDWDRGLDVERQVFLIGDAPPHLDYTDGPDPEEIIITAVAERIVINTVGCRSLPKVGVSFFRRMAYATEGAYQHIGRVRADAPGLAEAMLETLRPVPTPTVPAATTPIGITLSGRNAGAEGNHRGVLAHYGESARGRGCNVVLSLGKGVGLAGPPSVAVGDGFLVVEVDLTQGHGGSESYDMERCVDPSTPIRISFGG